MTDVNPFLGPIDRSRHEILVVDDDPASRYATARLLRSVGFRTREAATGVAALQLAEEGVSAVVLDVHLPDIDGFEICRILRTRSHLAHLPVLHLSAAYVTNDDKVRGLDAGADAYLTHPVEPAVIVATVQALVRARMAEDAMRQSEAKFRAIYANAPSGICLIDAEGRFVEVNAAMLALLGRAVGDVVGHKVSEFAPPEVVPIIDERMSQPLSASWRAEFPLRDARDRLVQIEWHVTPLAAPPHRLAMASDVSDRLLLEAARQELLEREQHARGEAERISRLKDDLIAVLSHELRSPLNAIMSWTHLLQLKATTEEARKGLQAIERNGRAQARLLADILDASRINTGKLRLELRPADPAELLMAVIDDLRPALDSNANELVLEVADDCPPVMADAARFQQIVWNLLSNAVKFSPRGRPITVSLRREGGGVRLSVADQGEGIEPDFLPFLFDRFSQGDVRTNRRHGGLGLGLSIVKQLAQLHGGSVCALSEGPDLGTVFHVDLPAAPAGSTRAPSVGSGTAATGGGVPARPAGKGRLQGLSILVVDDDADACATLAMILGDHGAEVLTAGSHDEALAVLETLVPDVLISDLGMPGKNGFELLRAVRHGEEPGQRITAIALTAFSRNKDIEEALAAGFDAHCAKPLRPLELVELIVKLAGTGALGR